MFLAIKSGIDKIYHINKKDLYITTYLERLSYATFRRGKCAQQWLGVKTEVLSFDDCIEELKKLKRIAKDKTFYSYEKQTLEMRQMRKEEKEKRENEKDYNKIYATEDKLPPKMHDEIKLNTINLSMQENARNYILHYIVEGGDKVAFGTFKGKVFKINGNKVLFRHLFIEFSDDGFDIIKGKEDHIWIFDGEEFIKMGVQEGDAIQFNALAYAYKRKDKSIDFSLKAPQNIQYIRDYELPSDIELEAKALQQIVCETCIYNEKCVGDCLLKTTS